MNVQLYMRIYVDGTFYVMDDGHMLLGKCFSKGIVIGILKYTYEAYGGNPGYRICEVRERN